MTRLLTIITQLSMCCSFILIALAHQWETIGHGLNPWIALPLATLFFLAPHLIDDFFIETEEADTSCIQLRQP